MNYEQVDRLLTAGWTKDEIYHLMRQEGGAEPEGAEEPEGGAEPEGTADSAPGMEQINKTINDALSNFTASIKKDLDEIKAAYQNYNLLWANNQAETSQGVEDILADLLLTPTHQKEKEK